MTMMKKLSKYFHSFVFTLKVPLSFSTYDDGDDNDEEEERLMSE
jgi:hypothetical protein